MLNIPEFQVSADLTSARNECLKKYPMLQIINTGLYHCEKVSKHVLKEIQDSIVDYLLFAGKPIEVLAEDLQPF
jgi:hypothetical protein